MTEQEATTIFINDYLEMIKELESRSFYEKYIAFIDIKLEYLKNLFSAGMKIGDETWEKFKDKTAECLLHLEKL